VEEERRERKGKEIKMRMGVRKVRRYICFEYEVDAWCSEI
jgi:hypothetical protein